MTDFLAGVELPDLKEAAAAVSGGSGFRTPANTYYVDGGYVGTSNGEQATPFTTIQAAIDAAELNDFGGTGLVTTRVVVEGRGGTTTYNETLLIGNKTILLEGQNTPSLVGNIQQRVEGIGFPLSILGISGFASVTGDVFLTEQLGAAGAFITFLDGGAVGISNQSQWTGDFFNPTIQKNPWLLTIRRFGIEGFINMGPDAGVLQELSWSKVEGSIDVTSFGRIEDSELEGYLRFQRFDPDDLVEDQGGIFRTSMEMSSVECEATAAANSFINSDAETIRSASKNQVVFYNCTLAPPSSTHEWFGDGSDGTLQTFGLTTISDFAQFTDGIVNTADTLVLEYPTRFTGTLEVQAPGIIDASGADGLSGSDVGTPGGGGAGGNDTAVVYPSSAGGAGQSPDDGESTSDRATLGGGGGDGGDGLNGGGGTGGTDILSVHDLANPGWLLAGHQPGSLQSNQIFAGIGGGGGGDGSGEYGAGATGGGGGGGGGGGAVVIAAHRIFVASGASIDVSGGDGGIGTDTYNNEDGGWPGSGGGGGGGVIILLYDALVGDPSVFCNVSGGAGGPQPTDIGPGPTTPPPGSFGLAGGDGRVILLPTHAPLITRYGSGFSYYGYGGVGGGLP